MNLNTELKEARISLIASGYLLLASAIIAGAGPAESATDETLPAHARTVVGESMPKFEALWALFMFVTALEEQQAGSGRDMLKSTVGLSEASAQILAQYIQDAVSSHHALSVVLMRQTCSSRARFTSRAAIAGKLNELDRSLDSQREAAVADLSGAIVAADILVLTHWVEANLRPKLEGRDFDHALYLAKQSNPRDVLDRLCGPLHN